MNKFIQGDCLEVMKAAPDASVNLIVTSPPYADARKKTYGGVKPDAYVEWFLPRAKEMLRVLADDGTFILNIKEKVTDGERHVYILDLIAAMRRQGWLWTEEFIWCKTTSMPGKWPTRFRDAWERCLQFNKSRKFAMYQDAVRVPVAESTAKRYAKIQEDDTREESATGAPFGSKRNNFVGRELVYPSNVLHMSPVTKDKGHSAAYPPAIPDFFIKLFSAEGDTVLDPFVGSGTTMRVAESLSRHCIGIDINPLP